LGIKLMQELYLDKLLDEFWITLSPEERGQLERAGNFQWDRIGSPYFKMAFLAGTVETMNQRHTEAREERLERQRLDRMDSLYTRLKTMEIEAAKEMHGENLAFARETEKAWRQIDIDYKAAYLRAVREHNLSMEEVARIAVHNDNRIRSEELEQRTRIEDERTGVMKGYVKGRMNTDSQMLSAARETANASRDAANAQKEAAGYLKEQSQKMLPAITTTTEHCVLGEGPDHVVVSYVTADGVTSKYCALARSAQDRSVLRMKILNQNLLEQANCPLKDSGNIYEQIFKNFPGGRERVCKMYDGEIHKGPQVPLK